MRERYNAEKKEIDAIVGKIISNGILDTYNKIRANAFFEVERRKDMGCVLLDMAEDFLSLGRREMDSKDNLFLINIYYTLHYMFRRLAHEINKKFPYEDDRFLRLVEESIDMPEILERDKL